MGGEKHMRVTRSKRRILRRRIEKRESHDMIDTYPPRRTKDDASAACTISLIPITVALSDPPDRSAYLQQVKIEKEEREKKG